MRVELKIIAEYPDSVSEKDALFTLRSLAGFSAGNGLMNVGESEESPIWWGAEARTLADDGDKSEAIARIAKEHLNIKSLGKRNLDRVDFQTQTVWLIREALDAAYEAGKDSVNDGE